MVNRARGETQITVPGVGTITLCLTMAGMAELEDEFGVENVQQAVEKIGENPSSTNMAKVLHALMLGTDQASASIEEIRRWPVTPGAIRDAMSAMNNANDSASDQADEAGNAPEENRKARRAKKAVSKKS